MRANAFNALEHIELLNILKRETVNLGLEMTEQNLRESLKVCGIPSNGLFWSTFVKAGFVKEIKGKLFVWNNPDEPIHYRALEKVYKQYQSKVNSYRASYVLKRKEISTLESPEIRAAIAMLKDLGFEIFAPKGNLYQKL